MGELACSKQCKNTEYPKIVEGDMVRVIILLRKTSLIKDISQTGHHNGIK